MTRRALVTGGARGIGAAIAARLRADGLEVVVLDRDQPCDVELDLAGDAELPDLGAVDGCVSNAAITTTVAAAHRMTREQWQRDLDVNLTGAFRVIQACLPGMRERGFGRIVVISSAAARSGLPGQVAYAASKAGLLGMTRTIAAENAHKGVTANAILPGLVATEAVLAMPEEILGAGRASIPTGRLVEPAEIADLVALLASDAAGSITGEAISVDGGIHLNTRSLTRRG
ncbi:MAG TPA: SDR family NAD(P)-dependent oxidoreductase [Solirubrobacteraceae bacterium]|nr:SDR family NAD(P)-dependent oxidoreductase [Solirubrobacteraceae bacterium]